jgi:hypothetical protein
VWAESADEAAEDDVGSCCEEGGCWISSVRAALEEKGGGGVYR